MNVKVILLSERKRVCWGRAVPGLEGWLHNQVLVQMIIHMGAGVGDPLETTYSLLLPKTLQ